ncbi:NAD(P)/FAD-dependent oxidoreductase [Thioalkalivibrio paradoxus]|uniref:Sulfide dehydrogenase [flavocytochrome C] flavoprotein chain n=1 Tax=Thioalkalivibrio paradoxus ARh 1 TaxID=713585 RepID=W0DRF9_9GAMM|nr:NAD(P)/FAD-dependent oxidoreductase [Thioalkalivibrio paradoxus]AHE99578.1 sulfide dehydrogenase [flavocytochrome C] flavoprotein chain [Thioalkalivibrio paradoxus ARh 1]
MANFTRRRFIQAAGLGSLAATLPFGTAWSSQTKARVVVVGGGTGGAIAARYVKALDPAIDVTIVEANPEYTSCYMSNWVLAEMRDLDSLTHGYDNVKARGINVVIDTATRIDTEGQKVLTAGGKSLPYDRLIVSPGIDFQWGAIEGYDEAASQVLPHAWKAGPQTLLLRDQVAAMPENGLVTIVAPPNPFRCPPGPYERAALIANFCTRHKPNAKIVIYDAKDAFSKQGLFQAGWERHYPGMIEWVGGFETGGGIRRVDPAAKTLHTDFDDFEADVINVIPPQTAGRIAVDSGLTDDSGWCPVDYRDLQSTLAQNVHVIGDAMVSSALPKSGYIAASTAKVAALAVVDHINGREPGAPAYFNTCYSLLTPEHSISVSGVYEAGQTDDGQQTILPVGDSVAVSPADADDLYQGREARYAASWYDNLIDQGFG